MSAIYYGGINLGYIKTTRFEDRAEVSKDKPDLVYRVTTIQVQSLLATEIIPANVGESLRDLVNRVRHELERPRRPFRYILDDGTVLIDLINGVDDANGPIPFGVSVTLFAEKSLVITWGVEVRLADCQGRLNPILSNRWSETATIDDEHLTTLRRSGHLIVAGRKGINPDNYRSLVTPRIAPKMVRKSSTYTLHENGLELRYDFVDEEKYVLPPYPAVKASGRMTEMTVGMIGPKRTGQVNCELTGPPGVDKKILFQRAMEVCMSRALQTAVFRDVNGSIIAGGGIEEDLFSNKVNVILRWNIRPSEQRQLGGVRPSIISGGTIPGLWGAIQAGTQEGNLVPAFPPKANANNVNVSSMGTKAGWIGAPIPGTGDEFGVAPPTRGDLEWLELLAPAFHDPCLTNYVNDPPPRYTPPTKTIEIATEPVATVKVGTFSNNDIPLPGSAFARETDDAVYNYWKCTSSYINDSGLNVTTMMKQGVRGRAYRLRGESLSLVVEFEASRTGRPPWVPTPQAPPVPTTSGPGWVFIGGTTSPENVEVAGDGVTLVHTISGRYEYKACDPCLAKVVAPIPPWLSLSVADEARMAAALHSGTMVFLTGRERSIFPNPFCDTNQIVGFLNGNGNGPNGQPVVPRIGRNGGF